MWLVAYKNHQCLKMFLIKLFILASISQSVFLIIQKKGPMHRKYAVQCLEQLTDHGYAFLKSKTRYHDKYLLTYVITNNLTTPGYEIQNELLKKIFRKKKWPIEVLQNTRNNFNSYSENCIADIPFNPHTSDRVHQPENCTRHHVVVLKSSLYVFIIDEYDKLLERLHTIFTAATFNRKALFVIYYTNWKDVNNTTTILKVFDLMVMRAMIHLVLLTPLNLTHFGVYLRRIKNVGDKQCFSQLESSNKSLYYYCNSGVLETEGRNVFSRLVIKRFDGCYLHMHALPFAPFVISNKSGIEIDIAKELGRILNISFRVMIYPYAASFLGDKLENGSWTGFLKPIYDDWDLGVGNISPEQRFLQDFTFSIGYHWVKLVFVAPIAPLIPRWRILTVIFSPILWGICLAAIFGFAILFCIFKSPMERSTYKGFQNCIEASYQLLIGQPVAHQPVSKYIRVYFISLAAFSIIIYSVYCSSLIYYLQTPIREHQIKNAREISMRNMSFGALKKYKAIFEVSTSKHAKRLLNSFQTVADANDTYIYWLKKVANEKNISTLAGKLFVKFLLSTNDLRFVDKYGQPKIFLMPKSIIVQQIAFMMKAGTLMEEPMNYIIQRFIIQAGISEKIKREYHNKILKEDSIEPSGADSDSNSNNDDQDGADTNPGVHSITPSQLQGAFAVLAMGLLVACHILIIEKLMFLIEKLQKKKLN